VAFVNGALRYWTRPADGPPDAETVRAILAAGGVDLADLSDLSVTGGRHRDLPPTIGACRIVGVNEVTSIGRGGQALALSDGDDPATPILVVSAGSGTAIVSARGAEYAHVTGTAVGGGTLLGIGRLLVGSAEATEIDALARRGDSNAADLTLKDVISGPIGALPANATAVNFGRLAREGLTLSREDLAASLMTLVGQVIAITAVNAARAERLEKIALIGHMTDMPSFRRVITSVGNFYGMELTLFDNAGYGTALGALHARR
jgi:type II pantothenate kinase